MKSKINNLNRKLELQAQEKIPDGSGGYIAEWKRLKYVWGSIEALSNTMNTNFDMLEIRAGYSITLRKMNRVDSSMRFVYGGAIYSIKYINDLDSSYVEIICEKVE